MRGLSKARIVKKGVCLYGDCQEYSVVIEESDMRYGTGDYEDSPEIADDVQVICYYIWFESLTCKGAYNAGGGCFISIDEAIEYVERRSPVQWG